MRTLNLRYRQANKEAMWALALTCAFFAWWYGFAYGLSPVTDALPTLYFGLPLWFLLSCIIGPILFTLLCALMVKYLYQDMSLDIEEHSTDEEQ